MENLTKLINPIWEGGMMSSVDDKLWDFEYLGLPKLWDKYGVKGEGVNVYVIDTGISRHKAYANNYRMYSFVGDGNPLDRNGHGSWCCGKIFAQDVGIAPYCSMTSLKALSDEGSGAYKWISDSLEFILREDKAHIVSMSLGGGWKDKTQEKLINTLRDRGVIVLAAAGNEDTSELSYPAAFDGALAVAAHDKNNKRAYFSNYGDHIIVSAPGVACYSTYLDSYRKLAGTSMATPTVAGLMALGASLLLKNNPKIDRHVMQKMLVKALVDTAMDLGVEGKDPFYGFGGLNGEKFMDYLK